MKASTFVLLAAVGTASSAQGAVIVSLSTTAPTTDILASSTSADNHRTWKNNTDAAIVRRDIGQSFLASATTNLDKITLRVNTTSGGSASTIGTGAPGAAFTLTIYQMGSASDATPDATVSTQSGTLPASFAGNDYMTFDLVNVPVTNGTTYGFALSFASAASQRFFDFWLKGAGSYAGGRALETDTAGTFTTTQDPSWDYQFYVQQVVPEPASLGLLSLGGFALLGRRRRVG